jgi:GntR family transcriptional regulator, transcriptional repressor for pyruvate dehydrogenase complex
MSKLAPGAPGSAPSPAAPGPVFKPVEKQRVAEEISEQLRRMILSGEYPPGSKLPPERELAKTLGVNRASLREALKKLEHLGLVLIRQGDGTRVRNFMETGGIELVQHLLPFATGKPEFMRDLLEFRRIFGREIARLAASRSNLPAAGDGIAKLRALVERAQITTSADALFEIDFEFYVVLSQITANQVMMLLINTVRDAMKPYFTLLANLAGPQQEVKDHQRRLFDAVNAGDSKAAATIADDYLRMGANMAARVSGRPELAPLPAE